MKSPAVRKMTVSALLIAVGILIPLVMPIKFVMEPVSFTLASHVAIFIGMLISPGIGAAVVIGTTLGFFISFPLVIALRAASHIVFALVGGFYIKKHPKIINSVINIRIFSLLIGILHAVCEVAVVSVFYFGGNMGASYYENGFFQTVLLLTGVGSVVHSMVDFEIAMFIYKILKKQRGFSNL